MREPKIYYGQALNPGGGGAGFEGVCSDLITLIDFLSYRTVTSVQAAISFLVGTLFIPLANEIKLDAINGKSRPTIDIRLAAGIGLFAERGQSFLFFSHVSFRRGDN